MESGRSCLVESEIDRVRNWVLEVEVCPRRF